LVDVWHCLLISFPCAVCLTSLQHKKTKKHKKKKKKGKRSDSSSSSGSDSDDDGGESDDGGGGGGGYDAQGRKRLSAVNQDEYGKYGIINTSDR